MTQETFGAHPRAARTAVCRRCIHWHRESYARGKCARYSRGFFTWLNDTCAEFTRPKHIADNIAAAIAQEPDGFGVVAKAKTGRKVNEAA